MHSQKNIKLCQELSTDVPPYPSKSACLNFPKPKAFYINYCSPLNRTRFDVEDVPSKQDS